MHARRIDWTRLLDRVRSNFCQIRQAPGSSRPRPAEAGKMAMAVCGWAARKRTGVRVVALVALNSPSACPRPMICCYPGHVLAHPTRPPVAMICNDRLCALHAVGYQKHLANQRWKRRDGKGNHATWAVSSNHPSRRNEDIPVLLVSQAATSCALVMCACSQISSK
jgi:hypothetical protein